MDYDVVIIGSGAGGGTLAYALSKQGKKILLIERGGYLPREKENWQTSAVFLKNRYHTEEKWLDKDDKPFAPGTGYHVGGNTKVYGAALLRLRREDFGEIRHVGGISLAWPLSYEDFRPYYLEAEKLYTVHGDRGADPTEPPDDHPYPYPRISHEPYIQKISDALHKQNLRPFHLPLGLRLNEKEKEKSSCIRCDTCDGFPCLVDAKSDAHISCVRPALATGNVTLMTEAKALRLIPDASGKIIQEVEVERKGEILRIRGRLFVASCGAINSAALFLRSTHAKHPNGLANGSGLVGRNYMFHQNSALVALSTSRNPTHYEKTLAINDYYLGAPDFEYPLGHIQLLGNVKPEMLKVDAPAFTPSFVLEQMANHAVGWWLTSEDLADPNNRVTLGPEGQIKLSYTPNNVEAHTRLIKKLKQALRRIAPHICLVKRMPIGAVAHQVGTMRFGKDPKTSVLDLSCKTHECENLYVVDASFFPSIGAVNPSLTIIANALRVGEKMGKQ